MLGSLARYLRFCGYDAVYALDRGVEADDRIASIAVEEDRTLITRDERLANRVDGSILLSERDIHDQLREVHERGVDLTLPETPVRCGRCNGCLERVPAQEPRPEYVPPVEVEPTVWRCIDCGQYFWRGSHWDAVGDRLAQVRGVDPADR